MASKSEPTKGTKPKTTSKPKSDASSTTTSEKTDKVIADAKANADTKTTPDAPAAPAVQAADADTEVAARSADVEAVDTEVHRKEFVQGPGDYSKGSGFSHEANIAGVRQYLINSGLRPVGDVKHVSTRTHEDGISKVLAYEVEAVPAHLAESYEVAHAEVIQSDDGSAPATDPSKA